MQLKDWGPSLRTSNEISRKLEATFMRRCAQLAFEENGQYKGLLLVNHLPLKTARCGRVFLDDSYVPFLCFPKPSSYRRSEDGGVCKEKLTQELKEEKKLFLANRQPISSPGSRDMSLKLWSIGREGSPVNTEPLCTKSEKVSPPPPPPPSLFTPPSLGKRDSPSPQPLAMPKEQPD